MSKIPYYFQTPVPRYFRENGFFQNPKNVAFVTWCFERCSNEERSIPYDGQIIILNSYQFIFGRKVCAEETGLTEDEVRTQQKRWENYGFLKKAPNKTPNRFTIYEWVLKDFLRINPQEKPLKTPKKPPRNPHNLEDKNLEDKKMIDDDAHARDQKISGGIVKNMKGEEIAINESQVYSAMAKFDFPTHIVEEALRRAKQQNGPFRDINRYIEATCRNLVSDELRQAFSDKKDKPKRQLKPDSAPPKFTGTTVNLGELMGLNKEKNSA